MLGIDILKIIAIGAVVALHTNFASDSFWRFSVPLFVALSGYGLVTSYKDKKINLPTFFVKRIWRILPWYLVVVVATSIFVFYPGIPLWQKILYGRADYHLYFVPMIMQLYLLFPVLLFLFKKISPKALVLFVLIGQIWWFWFIGQKTEVVGDNNSLWPDQQQYRYFISWIWYFVLGMALAFEKKFSVNKYFVAGVILFGTGLILTLINSTDLIGRGIDLYTATRFTRLPVLIYATGVILLGKCLIDGITQKFRIITYLAGLSYLVYLIHPLVMRLDKNWSFAVVLTVSFVLAGFLDKMARVVWLSTKTIIKRS